ncbi:MAG: O-methyltransferase [Muribaculaceae bacterium]|nr:O-methyltransferase [Muribaculaceae bacterium]
MDELLKQYVLAHIDAEPENLRRLDRDTHLRLLYSRMCSGHLQGRLLKMLVRMINPRRVLELGTYSGYSALCMAEGLLRDDACIHTIEIEDELEDFLREHFAQSPVGHRINLHIGDAVKVLGEMEGDFDLAFIDANKRDYVDYYDLVLPRIAPGGFIIADNTLWDGKVVDWGKHLDAQTAGILAFNDRVAADPRVEVVIVPLRDGLTIIHKKTQY